jgi:hypothetical protein
VCSSDLFVYKNVLGSSNNWNPFMPTRGHVAYAHLDHFGQLGIDKNNFNTFTRGTWMPLFAPYFGERSIVADNNFYPCPEDDPGQLSIEVVYFEGYARNSAVELTWETASETNNHSFIIERYNVNDNVWAEIDHVPGAGNSTSPNVYRLRDSDVVSGNTYKYRLYNVDFEGAISCPNNNVITVEYNNNSTIDLSQNTPNPFGSETHFTITIPETQEVTIEVVDIFGKTVKTIVSNETLKGTYNYSWNGTDESGMKVADGNYIYRLTAGNEILIKKMSYIKSY